MMNSLHKFRWQKFMLGLNMLEMGIFNYNFNIQLWNDVNLRWNPQNYENIT